MKNNKVPMTEKHYQQFDKLTSAFLARKLTKKEKNKLKTLTRMIDADAIETANRNPIGNFTNL